MSTILAPPVASFSGSDPTLQLFRDLENPSLYRKVENAPIFTDFRGFKKDSAGKDVPVNVDVEKLRAVVARQHEIQKTRRVIPRITPGHTLPGKDVPEPRQPPQWGWSKDWFLGTFEGKPQIFGTLYFSKKPIADDSGPERRYVIPSDEAHTYPYRSAEYYADRNEITGIAILRRDPQLDMGILACWGDESITYFAAGFSMESPSTPSTPSTPSGPAKDPTMPPQATAPSPEESETFMRCMRHNMPHLASPGMQAFCEHMAKGGHPMQFSMPGMPASPSLTAPGATPPLPSTPGEHPMHNQQIEEAVRMQREQDAIRFKRLEDELAAEKGLRLGAEKIARRNGFEQTLTQIDGEGFLFNRAEEIARFDRFEEKAKGNVAEVTEYVTDRAKDLRQRPRDITKMPMVEVANTGKDGLPDAGGKAVTEQQVAEVLLFQREEQAAGRYHDFPAAERLWHASRAKK